jgi:hypothetical protein
VDGPGGRRPAPSSFWGPLLLITLALGGSFALHYPRLRPPTMRFFVFFASLLVSAASAQQLRGAPEAQEGTNRLLVGTYGKPCRCLTLAG